MFTSEAPAAGRRDLERAVAELAERLPAPLSALAGLAYNYRWSWTLGGEGLFREIDPALWQRCCQNPRDLLEASPPARLRRLAADAAYVARVARVAAEVEADLRRPSLAGESSPARPIAYFCSEFGGHCSLPIYGGGLGVLAGDVVKAASDVALPLVCVTLFYRHGYFHQRLDAHGRQHEYWQSTEIERLPAALVTDGEDRPLTVSLEIRGRTVHVQIWRVEFGRIPIFLLDTDRADNDPIDRFITSRLYVGDRHTRLAQYAVLGCGGMRALTALLIAPGLIHLNEGHAALGAYERLGALLGGGATLDAALAAVRAGSVFTTHTPVAAGNEWYSQEEIEPVLGELPARLHVPSSVFYDLGRFNPGARHEPVNLTPLALRTSRTSIGVSAKHGEVARAMWQRIWPGRPPGDVPIGHVTNGVHTTTWMAAPMQQLLDRFLPDGWRARVADPAVWDSISRIPDAELWRVRQELRTILVLVARERSVADRLARGESPDYVEAALRMFDPNALTIGFARRVATYKRLHLLTRHADRALRLLANAERPIQLVIAGKAHPSDEEAKEALRGVFELRSAPWVASRVVFLEDYDLRFAPAIVAGVDLWLNLPRPPMEASGTSGMKVALNGGLNLSVLDGWWCEGYDPETGWAIDSREADVHAQDDLDAATLFSLVGGEVIPLFYERDAEGIPTRWLARVRASMQRLIPRFSTDRMIREYIAALYGRA